MAGSLYFLGLYWQHTRGSALIGWVKDDAAYIAAQIQTLADRQIQTLADRRKARPNPANHEHPIRAEAQEESHHVEPQ